MQSLCLHGFPESDTKRQGTRNPVREMLAQDNGWHLHDAHDQAGWELFQCGGGAVDPVAPGGNECRQHRPAVPILQLRAFESQCSIAVVPAAAVVPAGPQQSQLGHGVKSSQFAAARAALTWLGHGAVMTYVRDLLNSTLLAPAPNAHITLNSTRSRWLPQVTGQDGCCLESGMRGCMDSTMPGHHFVRCMPTNER